MNTVARSMTKAFLSSRVLGVPFWVMLGALSLILYKEFHVSPFLLTFLVALKPASALFATYWSSLLHGDSKNLVFRIAIANVLRFLPFLFVPWMHSPWLLVFAFGWYMMLSRGCVPAWMELFKQHLPGDNRSRILGLGNTLEYIGVTLLPLTLGVMLDLWTDAWKLLFVLTALCGMGSTLFLFKLPPHLSRPSVETTHRLIRPWSQAKELLKTDVGFRKYQIGFMLGGAGLMILQPALPPFFVDHLSLSYTQMMLALSVCKGIGYTLASPFWSRLFNRSNLFIFSAIVTFFAALFPLLLYCSSLSLLALYIGYISYGMMQAGSEMSWHLSPLSFSKKSESLPYSETNILAVGVRGCIIPFIGGLLAVSCPIGFVLTVSSLLCLGGMIVLALSQRDVVEKIPLSRG